MQPGKIEDLIVFSVPWKPPTVNHYWVPTMYRDRLGYVHRGRKLSDEARAWKDAVAIFAQGRTVAPASSRERKKARYKVKIHVYLAAAQRGDADNFNKGCLDGLQDAGVIHSDAAIETCEITVHRDERDNPENPRTQFIVERL
jgi:Holliday junction resolvase RusA-like endonuclease